ncbi:hypothetical protein Tsubulata_004978 [Turnera subulata]|uniref:Uncharacterized protein n=1 Tax=Turnera subulata TaxID=218843 RepID=A0A9Q0FSS3_9ROSI|nr:hypothetical protein Tsubulata_004978 [Turnera subulata]
MYILPSFEALTPPRRHHYSSSDRPLLLLPFLNATNPAQSVDLMEANLAGHNGHQETVVESAEEEYVLLDLDDVAEQVDIPPNAPYGLDTLEPILTIDDKIKLKFCLWVKKKQDPQKQAFLKVNEVLF